VGHLFRFVGGGFYLSNLWNPRSLSVGASAALCGLIGAMIALGVTHHSAAMGAAIRSTYMRWAIYILIFSFLPGWTWRRISRRHHGLRGGVPGGTPRYEGSPVERLWQAGALICLGLTG